MKLRSARTLVFARQQGEMVGYNFLAKTAFCCSHDLLTFLSMMDEWTELEAAARLAPNYSAEGFREIIDSLLEVHALTRDDSEIASAEDEFDAKWKWGIPAALFHFSVQDRDHLSLEQNTSMQLDKLAGEPPPALYTRNDARPAVRTRLPCALAGNDLLQLMAKRRTVRAAHPRSITLGQLSECLFAGLGITGETRNSAGALPLSMTPSGGARNPFEAFVYVREVDGLEPGIYHYAAIDHSLARIPDDGDLPAPSDLVGGQDWADEMPCIVILCAMLERTMWKYEDPNAYRVVLIEAGHIGQNVMLAATRHDLTACPTAALNHAAIRRSIGDADAFTHAPVYALTIGHPAPERAALLTQ